MIRKKIIDESRESLDTKIVLSSTWRVGVNREGTTVPKMYKYFQDRLRDYGLSIYDRTPYIRLKPYARGDNRGEEIVTWLISHLELNITEYLVLDDCIAPDYERLSIIPHLRNTNWNCSRRQWRLAGRAYKESLGNSCRTNSSRRLRWISVKQRKKQRNTEKRMFEMKVFLLDTLGRRMIHQGKHIWGSTAERRFIMADYGFGGDINGNGSFDPSDYEIWKETMKDSGGSYSSGGRVSSGARNGGGAGSLIGNILLWSLSVAIWTGVMMVGLCLLVICPPLGGLMIMGAFEMMKKM